MPLSFQITVSDYVKPGEPAKLITVKESDKGGRVLAFWAITMQAALNNLAPATIHEVKISERMFGILKSSGEVQVVEYQPAPDDDLATVQQEYDMACRQERYGISTRNAAMVKAARAKKAQLEEYALEVYGAFLSASGK